MKSFLISGISCLAIGLAVGAIFASRSPMTSSQVETHTIHRERGGLDRGELAEVVRQELARERQQTPAVAPAAPAETADEARARMNDDETEHAQQATRVLREAVARGQWTMEDRGALAAEMAKLPAAVQAEIGGQLAVALNKGELTMEGDWLPL